jgi:SAM-dependent methyltransferase
MIDRSLNYGREHIESFLESSAPYASVLDLGAGSGADLLLARKKAPEARLLALEGLPANLERLVALGVEAKLHELERDRFPYPDQSIDVVMANQVLEHTKEIFWIVHEVSRTLRVGGRFIVGIPNLAALHNRVLLGLGRQPSPIKTLSAHVRGFTRGDFLDFLDGCFPQGYRLVDFRGANFYPFPPLLARPLARIFPTLAWGIFFLLEKTKPYSREFLDAPMREQLETPFFLGPQAGEWCPTRGYRSSTINGDR